MAIIVVSKPAVPPLSVVQVKDILHIDYDDDDIAVETALDAAVDKLERRCGRVFVQRTLEYRTDEFERQIELPILPVQSVSSITYFDSTGVQQTLDPLTYIFISGGDNDSSVVISASEWPSRDAVFKRPDAVRIQFAAGYAPIMPDMGDPDYVTNVPDGIKQAVSWLCGHFLSNRESVIVPSNRQVVQEVPDTVAEMIAPFIVPRL